MARTQVEVLARRLGLDTATTNLAQDLIAGENQPQGRFAPHCAVLVASQRCARKEVSLKEVWTGESDIEINEFFRTLEACMNSWEVECEFKCRLVEMYHRFEFEITFFRKFEELRSLIDASSDIPLTTLRKYSWFLFLTLRHMLVPQSLDIVKTVFVLLGALIHTFNSPTTLNILADKLKVTPEETKESYSKVTSAIAKLTSEGIMKSNILDSISALDGYLSQNLSKEAVDPRDFLIPDKIKVSQSANRSAAPTPISQHFEVENWIASLRDTEESLLAVISTWPEADRNFEYRGFTQRVRTFKEVLGRNSEFSGSRGDLVIRVYLKQLVLLMETKRKSQKEEDFMEGFVLEAFHKGLLAVSIESVLFAHNLFHISYEEVLQMSDISPFDFWKILKSVISLDILFPKSLKRHFHLIDEKIVTAMAWTRYGPVHQATLALDKDSTPSEDEGGERSVKILLPYGIFFKQVAKFAAKRVVDLCEKLMLDDFTMEKVWDAVKFLMSEQTEILIGKHLDQIIICTVYGVCEEAKTVSWPDLISCYGDLNPSEFSFVSRSVRTFTSTLSIDRFYAIVVKPRLRDFRRIQPRLEPRIKELSPIEGVREAGMMHGSPTKHYPMKSPFRDPGLTPTSQRLFGPVATPESHRSERYLNLEKEEEKLQNAPDHLKTILAKSTHLQLPVFGRKEK